MPPWATKFQNKTKKASSTPKKATSKVNESEKPNRIDLTTKNNSKKENVNHTQITADCEKPKLKEKLKKNKRMVTIVKDVKKHRKTKTGLIENNNEKSESVIDKKITSENPRKTKCKDSSSSTKVKRRDKTKIDTQTKYAQNDCEILDNRNEYNTRSRNSTTKARSVPLAKDDRITINGKRPKEPEELSEKTKRAANITVKCGICGCLP